jgi:intracellular sulfur oxidation DsrE/DsrF family protein
MRQQQSRREFLEHLSVASAGFVSARSLPASSRPLSSSETEPPAETWDMSWLQQLERAQYRAVIDANVVEDGYAFDLTNGLMSDFSEVHRTPDDKVAIIVVARRQGTPIVFGDALWDKYPIGEDTKLTDSATKAPYRRNPFLRGRAGAAPETAATKIETLRKRGLILIVCNIAAHNWARSLAQKTNRDVADVKKDVFDNLVPGTIVMPSGVFTLMRAQNAGCAYMRGQ